MDRPHVHMNVAMTADGKIDSWRRDGATISTERDWERVDRLRAESEAVMIGGRTLHGEDPTLTVSSGALRRARRSRGLPENPIKVAVAGLLALKPGCKFLTGGSGRIILFTTSRTPEAEMARVRSAGAEVFVLGEERVDLRQALLTLKEEGVERLMVEGGATLNFAMLDLGLVDELTIFVAPMIFGGESAPTLAGGVGLPAEAAVALNLVKAEQWDDGGVLLHYLVKRAA